MKQTKKEIEKMSILEKLGLKHEALQEPHTLKGKPEWGSQVKFNETLASKAGELAANTKKAGGDVIQLANKEDITGLAQEAEDQAQTIAEETAVVEGQERTAMSPEPTVTATVPEEATPPSTQSREVA